MAVNGWRKEIQRRLYAFARRRASALRDSRRRRVILEMIVGLIVGGHVYLNRIARAVGSGWQDVHSAEKRLSRHLASEHWDASPPAEVLLHDSAATSDCRRRAHGWVQRNGASLHT